MFPHKDLKGVCGFIQNVINKQNGSATDSSLDTKMGTRPPSSAAALVDVFTIRNLLNVHLPVMKITRHLH